MTKIEWTDETVNLAVGCTRVSPGCERCYAERFVHRQMQPAHAGLTVVGKGEKGPRWNGKVRFLPERLTMFQSWKKPKRIFINSLSDTFHPALTHEQRLAMFGAFVMAPQHTYQVLTKRPEIALDFERWLVLLGERERLTFRELAVRAYCDAVGTVAHWRDVEKRIPTHGHAWWIGVTAEDQQRADERIPRLLALHLLPTLRFVSYEPALGPVDFKNIESAPNEMMLALAGLTWSVSAPSRIVRKHPKLDWVIVGGESGPKARPMHVGWASSAIRQCREAGVPVFMKQAGAHVITRNDDNFTIDEDPPDPTFPGWPTHLVHEDRIEHGSDRYQGAPVRVRLRHGKGADMTEWRSDLRVREFPR